MIGAGNPAGIFSLHPGATHKYILDAVVQAMSHVEHAGNIRRWDYYGIWLPFIRFTVKIFSIQPMRVPFIFCCSMIEILTQFHKRTKLPELADGRVDC